MYTRFGLSLEQVKDMEVHQNGLCAICGSPETRKLHGRHKRLAVDHCHKTGEVRGLLCGSCNTALGLFREDLDILASATSYLINSKQKAAS